MDLEPGQRLDKLHADTCLICLDEYLPRAVNYETLSPRQHAARASSNKAPSRPRGSHGGARTITETSEPSRDAALKRLNSKTKKRELNTHTYTGRTHRHRRTDVASGVEHVCLPLQGDSEQTQSNEIHCREPVSREAETELDHVRRQSTQFSTTLDTSRGFSRGLITL